MSALLLFVGVVIGVAITILAGLAVVHWPEPERDREPVRFSAIGSGRSHDDRTAIALRPTPTKTQIAKAYRRTAICGPPVAIPQKAPSMRWGRILLW